LDNAESLHDGVAFQTHKDVPLLLITDCRQTSRHFILFGQSVQPDDTGVLWIDGLGESNVSRCILVAIVHNRLVGESGKVGERIVHLLSGALEESAVTANEQGIPSEYATRVGRISFIGNVVADRILGVAGSR
jgi:hypothetical protein